MQGFVLFFELSVDLHKSLLRLIEVILNCLDLFLQSSSLLLGLSIIDLNGHFIFYFFFKSNLLRFIHSIYTFSARAFASRACCSQSNARSIALSFSSFIPCIFFLIASILNEFFLSAFYHTKEKINKICNETNEKVRNQSFNKMMNSILFKK